MLVLSRYEDEVVKIGDDIEVRVVDIRDGRVRLGFTAPKDTKIYRKELCENADAFRKTSRSPQKTDKIPAVHGIHN